MLPLGIDAKGILTGLTEIEEGLAGVTTAAKQATTQMSDALGQAAKNSDALNAKLGQGAEAAQKLQTAAKQAGTDLEKAFSPDKINTNGITEKLGSFVAKMRDAIGKPVDFRFNIDKSSIDLLTNQLKGAKTQTEGFALILETAKKQLAGMAQGTPAFATLSKQIQDADKFLNVLMEDVHEVVADLREIKPVDPVPEQAEPKVKSLRTQLKEMRLELAAMELAGKAGTEEFVALSEQAGNLADQLGDTSQRIAHLASDTKGLDAGVSAVRGLAGAFAIGQGALAAFGEQSEEAAKAIQKVQGAMAILQGIQEVANVLNKDSALMVYLQTYARQAHTAAIVEETAAETAQTTATVENTATTEAATVVTEANTIATEAAVVATESLTAALLANPITAIIAVLAVAAVALYTFAQAQKEVGLSTEEANKMLEAQQKFLEEDIAITDRRLKVKEAEANALKRNQSVLTQIGIDRLNAQISDNKLAIEDAYRTALALDTNDKNYAETRQKILDRIDKLEKDNLNAATQINADRIKMEREKKEELAKLQLDTLKQRFANGEAERAILQQTRAYANDIQASKIAEMKDGQDKEIATIKKGVADKIAALDQEHGARLRNLQEQRKEAQIELSVAGEADKDVIALRIEGLNQQIALEQQQGKTINDLKAQVTEEGEIAAEEVRKKYRAQQIAFDYDIQQQLLALEKDSTDKRLEQLRLAAEAEINAISAKNLTKENQEKAINAVMLQLEHDSLQVEKEQGLKQIELEKQKNVNLINENKLYATQSNRIIALKNIEILKEELSAAQKQLDLLKKSGDAATEQELANAEARVNAAKQGLQQAVGNTPPQTVMSLLLPGASQKELDFATQQVSSVFNSIGQAVDSYSKLVQDRYQKMIDAKQAAIDQDNQELDDLRSRLQAEIALRDAGYASNIQGILDQMNAKEQARQEDLKQQEAYQQELQKSQKAQADAQTALQAANLITASTNIYLQATAIGGPFAVPVAVAAIAAMLGAFVISKAQTYEAIQPIQFGDGGMIGGKSHAEGGQKYFSPDRNAGVMELEEGEFVTSKKQTEKFMPLLEVINNNAISSMSDREMRTLLSGLGVHMDMDDELATALKESREHTAFQVNNTVINTESETTRQLQAENSKELTSINKGVQRLVQQNDERETRYIENGYEVIEKGKKKTKIKI